MQDKKVIFISSRQIELQNERNKLRDFINLSDELLPKIFIAKTFEFDLSGRRESVNNITEDWVLKSDIYLGIFDREYSEATLKEYWIAKNDKQVKKEIVIFIKKRNSNERESKLNNFLKDIMDPDIGHACIIFDSIEDLLCRTKQVLIDYYGRKIEGFILSKEFLGENLKGAKNTYFPEKFRRQLLQPIGRFVIWKGRKGIPEYFRYDWNGTKIDVTWDYIEPSASEEVKEFYRKRYKKPFDP
jgi:hypothetical protein